jgi:hypothetical protein
VRIAGSGFDRAPRDHPLEYPGAIPDASFLYRGDSFHPLADAREECAGLRLGEWQVVWNDGTREQLDDCLTRLSEAPTRDRTPVLAYGSNAAPAQLERKYGGDHDLIPVARATLSGLDVVFAGKVASYGAVPATVVPSPSATVDVAVTFLDDQQLQVLDRTERTYERRRVTDGDAALVLRSGERLGAFEVYVSEHGPLLIDGSARRLAAVRATGSELPEAGEPEVLAAVVERWNEASGERYDVPGFLVAVADKAVPLADLAANLRTPLTPLGVVKSERLRYADLG